MVPFISSSTSLSQTQTSSPSSMMLTSGVDTFDVDIEAERVLAVCRFVIRQIAGSGCWVRP